MLHEFIHGPPRLDAFAGEKKTLHHRHVSLASGTAHRSCDGCDWLEREGVSTTVPGTTL